jgi:mannose/fructose/N-acetylgalactosamine-specific phosphotransferase system component IIC
MVRIWLLAPLCFGLVLIFSHAAVAVSLPMPEPEVLGAMIKDELMEYLEILTENIVPAVGFSLIIRKVTS